MANWEERSKKAGMQPDRTDRQAFQKWLDTLQTEENLHNDAPLVEVISAVNSLYADGHRIVFLTGRSEIFRTVTTTWLLRHTDIASPCLFMRSSNDWRSAAEYKEAQLKMILKDEKELVLACDDDYDGDTTHVYRKMGIRHLKVMK